MARLKKKGLAGHVAVVAGATRGAGRGIARALGEAGATAYCTGRSGGGNLSRDGRPETIDATAYMINAAGDCRPRPGRSHRRIDRAIFQTGPIAAGARPF